MGKLTLLVLVVAAVTGQLAGDEAAVEKKLEAKTEVEKEDTVAKIEPSSSENGAEDRRAYNIPGGPSVQQQQNLNVARAHAAANAQGQGYAPGNPVYPQNPINHITPVPPHLMVECHSCTDCEHVTKDTARKLCPMSFDPAKSGKCVSYAIKYGKTKNKWHVRGCASDLGSCQDVKNTVNRYPDPGSLLSCKECDSNLCNAGEVARSLPAFGIASLVLVVIPLLKNKLLS